MPDTTLYVRSDAPIGTISPRLYGHFAEHLGRCCYEGLWLGTERTDIQQHHGFRADVLQALRALPVPLLRWPGGCYADHYHWRDGIGPVADRPRRIGMSCDLQVEDDNSLGTHEFLWLCAELGAEPYLAGNMGTGSPQEIADWIEYCNSALDTTLTRLRRSNEQAQPWNVRLWGVGNENWGCGGNYDATTYAYEYRRYATMLRHIDPTTELVACGYDDAWNAELLRVISKHPHLIDHLSIHSYWIDGGPESQFGTDDYYRLLAEAEATENFVTRTADIIRQEIGDKRHVGIALDEWGVWHPEARAWGPGTVERRQPMTYEQANTLRDALAVGIAFEGFHRQCTVLSLANIAQIVNVLQAVVMTDGAHMWLTPTYHAFRLHAPHIGATALPVEIAQSDHIPGGGPAVSGTASRTAHQTTVTLINRSIDHPVSVRVRGVDHGTQAQAQVLTADSPRAQNSAAQPDRVAPRAIAAQRDGDDWRVDLPPHSLATLVLRP